MSAVTTDILPVTFGGHFGALHRPASGETAGMAVVICPTLGREGRCAYRTLFHWAETLASRGFHVLRYDPMGEGDSAPLDRNGDQLTAWTDGVVQAADFVRSHTGARELVLAGLRMGGALALAASASVEPDGLILMAPILTGAAWLRDLKMSAAIQKLPPSTGGELEVDGLWLSPATMRSLEQLDTSLAKPNWRGAFLATPGSAGKLAGQLGPAVTATRFEGYSQLFKEPYVNQSPEKLLGEACGWLEAFSAGAAAAPLPPPRQPAQLEGDDWIERAVTFGDGLRGILCLPRRRGGGRARGVLMGNTAADPRAGVGNFGARASRALASRGVAALRFDFSGLGESDGERGHETDIYVRPRLDDFRAAAALLKAEGCHDLTLLGVCTGGYQAVHAVLQSTEFRRAIAFNAWLVWRTGRPLDLRSETADPKKRRASARPEASPLWKVLHGEINVAEALLRKARLAWSALWPDGPCREVRREIRRAGRGGAEIHVVLGRGDVALRGLEADFGLNCGWLRRQRGVSVRLLPWLDHALFSIKSQEFALREVFRIVGVDASDPPPAAAKPSKGPSAASAQKAHDPV